MVVLAGTAGAGATVAARHTFWPGDGTAYDVTTAGGPEAMNDEAIYNEVARGIGQSQQETGIPHAFGVLTCETLEQALDRAGLKAGNKGFEAASAAIEMVSLHRKVGDQAAKKIGEAAEQKVGASS